MKNCERKMFFICSKSKFVTLVTQSSNFNKYFDTIIIVFCSSQFLYFEIWVSKLFLLLLLQ